MRATRDEAWRNWSGLEHARPGVVLRPADEAEVVAAVADAVASGGRVKMVGSGHSFTGIANADGTLLLPDQLSGIVDVDRERGEVTALPGTRLSELNAVLERLGLSLHNMGDIAEQTLAGATATGTHGSGGRVSSLSAQVTGLTLVTGTGEVLRCDPSRNPDVFAAARLGLGALGIVTSLTLAVEPLFVLEADERPMGWADLLASYDDLCRAADHVDAYWFPHTDRTLVKTNTRVGTDVTAARPPARLAAWWEDELLSNTVFGAVTALGARVPGIVPAVNQLSARALSPRRYSDVAHRVFTSPRRVVFREMEYAVPGADGLEVLRECRRVIERGGWRVGFPVEIRNAPGDDVLLSTASERDSLYLAFHTHRAQDHRDYFGGIEPVLRAAGGRPHWGKLHAMSAPDLAAAYPRFGDFLALRERLDPNRVFANGHLARVLGD